MTEPKECPGCGSMNIVHDSKGQTICKECGIISAPAKPIAEAFSIERLMKMRRILKPAKKAAKKAKKPAKKKAKKKPAKKKIAKKKAVKKAKKKAAKRAVKRTAKKGRKKKR